MISKVGHRYTIVEFEQFAHLPENRERHFELIDGAIVEKVRSEEHEFIVANFATYVGRFVIKRGLGRIVLDAYRHAPNDEYTALLPDIAFTRREHLQPVIAKGGVPQIPDLVIEVLSRAEQFEAARVKVDYYLANGGQMVWVVNLKARSVTVHNGNTAVTVKEGQKLSGGTALPGFSLTVKDIFDID